ncbi:hypothetical protein J416_12557 [Gracilibacillus halophilus YIM-C55.5]|uniref:GIY-YIG domain-containing protein n=1 Tax=Gracilibacillus halophilus YIM-C55.5 TaxID=1308866 RepID=N4W7A0_9BACI|nr:GIY-YIG nuclease family protein [Gracilibacillus halophilus]ENH96113.1 hypothetical protein J416_12557 [Gracilibacillus halophilus YIM-C55.5]
MGQPTNHFVYILQCADETFYTGYTTDIDRRLRMHESGKGAKYTRGRGPFTVVYQMNCQSKSEALQLEAKIKKLSRTKKQQWIDYYQGRCDTNETTKKFS